MGYVYMLSNPAMPGLVKIGTTDDVEERRRQLSIRTSVAKSYKIEAVYGSIFGNAKYVETALHKYLANYRVDKTDFRKRKPEFFRLNVHEAREKIRRYLLQGDDDYVQQNKSGTAFRGLSEPVSREVLDFAWEVRRAEFSTGLQNELEAILPASYYTRLRQEDFLYIQKIRDKLETLIGQYSFKSIFCPVFTRTVDLFIEIFSSNYLVYFSFFLTIGRIYDESFEEFFPIKSCNGNPYKSPDPHVEILSLICKRIQQEEQQIISYVDESSPTKSG